MNDDLAPIALFVYNRPEHTKRTIESLKRNIFAGQSELYIFSDSAKSERQADQVKEVRKLIRAVNGFKKIHIIEAKKNKGLASSIIGGVSQIINEYGKVIVLEDDLITSPVFLKFMNEALVFYEDNSSIWSIAGYNYPIEIPDYYQETVYFFYRASSWGWASWKDRWDVIDWDVKDYNKYKYNLFKIAHFCKGGTDLDKMLRNQMQGKSDSWAIRWCYSQNVQGKLTVYPCQTLVSNIGIDGSGTHCDNGASRFLNTVKDDFDYRLTNKITVDKTIAKNYRKMVDRSVLRRLKRVIRGNK